MHHHHHRIQQHHHHHHHTIPPPHFTTHTWYMLVSGTLHIHFFFFFTHAVNLLSMHALLHICTAHIVLQCIFIIILQGVFLWSLSICTHILFYVTIYYKYHQLHNCFFFSLLQVCYAFHYLLIYFNDTSNGFAILYIKRRYINIIYDHIHTFVLCF